MSWENAIKRSKIPKMYQNCSFENCQLIPKKIIELGKKWVNHPRRPNLYLFGNTGSGKTHFATSLYRAMVENYESWIVFVTSDDLDIELLDSIDLKRERSCLEKYCEVPILFIDDLGVERASERMIRQYYTIINKRIVEQLTTIITSNVSKNDIALGDRTRSRLEHFLEIEFPNVDIRKKIELTEL